MMVLVAFIGVERQRGGAGNAISKLLILRSASDGFSPGCLASTTLGHSTI